ncbi:type II secretion system protein [Comamonas sp. EJ-4]|uniref:Type II secretion system protein n=2 Tax=Comamonas suwonensis TaxID=2606214 RepID=A0A843BH96_9BURK|nr:type II secretion system protein [Comamonas suwonensis]
MNRRMKGFTLVELSVVLLALGIILPAAVMLWQFAERQRVTAVQMTSQQQARDALVGFLHANYRLPCPAADANGVEICTDGAGLRQVGFLPWRTLGLPDMAAKVLRYGVYRQPDASAPLDKDLAVVRDRMNPVRVATPKPKPMNGDGPNPHIAPVPQSAAILLGTTQPATQSVAPDAPIFNASCDAANSPPCPFTGPATTLVDICLALNVGSVVAGAPAGFLATDHNGVRRTMAFVLAAPGMLDADGDGQAFDGANATATSASPTFASVGTQASSTYDDSVMAASHTELFTELHCAPALASIAHAHFNTATSALVMERALYDYRDQLFIAVKLAEADVAAATAGMAGAAAAVADGPKEIVSASADTVFTFGGRSFQIGLAAAGVVVAVIAAGAAAYALADAIMSLDEAKTVHSDFADRTTAMTDLAISINNNTLTADALGH